MRLRFPVLFAALLGGCSGAPGLVEYGVWGYVREASSDDPVSGVEVTFTSDTLRTARDESDGDGRYEILVESDTAFGHLTARDPRGRYEAEIVEVYFDERTRRVDIALGPVEEEK